MQINEKPEPKEANSQPIANLQPIIAN